MKYLLRSMVRPLYHYLKNKREREFYRLHDKWGRYERYKKIAQLRFLEFTFDVPDAASFIWQFKELFVDDLYQFKNKNETPIILDCGANVGTSCLYFKTLYPNAKITAFEADKSIATMLKQNMEQNGHGDIEVVAKAVWNNSNGIEFSKEGADAGSIFGSGKTVKIESIRLKEYLEKEVSIDLLKMDIEGAEYNVLTDCKDSLKHVENIFIEYHSINGTKQHLGDVLNILRNNGFRYYLENINQRKSPLINQNKNEHMDLQLNIFGVRR